MADKGALKALTRSARDQNGCAAWNQWRRERDNQLQYFHNASIAETAVVRGRVIGQDNIDRSVAAKKSLELGSIDLGMVNLSSLNLSHADFSSHSGDTSTRVLMIGANLSKTVIDATDFSGTALIGVDFRSATVRNLRLLDNDCHQADFSGAELENTELLSTNLRDAKFVGAKLTHVLFVKADLRGADFTNATLDRWSPDMFDVGRIKGWDKVTIIGERPEERDQRILEYRRLQARIGHADKQKNVVRLPIRIMIPLLSVLIFGLSGFSWWQTQLHRAGGPVIAGAILTVIVFCAAGLGAEAGSLIAYGVSETLIGAVATLLGLLAGGALGATAGYSFVKLWVDGQLGVIAGLVAGALIGGSLLGSFSKRNAKDDSAPWFGRSLPEGAS